MLTKVQSNCGGMGSALAVITLFKSSVSSAKLCMCNLKYVLQSNCSLEIFFPDYCSRFLKVKAISTGQEQINGGNLRV